VDQNGKQLLTAEEEALLSIQRTRNIKDAEIFYVNDFTDDNPGKGESFSTASVANAACSNAAILSVALKDYGTLGHEVGHCLDNLQLSVGVH
jgi:hypothetical protein